VDLRYLSTTASLVCILSGGDIVLIKPEAEEYDEKVEIIGNMEGGILAAQWTLDEEILALTSGSSNPPPPPPPPPVNFSSRTNSFAGDSKLLFMTPTFEAITEIPLSPADIAQHINQVSVGWGRAETQFRGLRAKNAPRDPTLPTNVEQGILSPHDDHKVRLHWRGDGEFIALSRIEREEGRDGRRVVRVYGRDGAVKSFSEAVDGMEGTLSWRPSGQWITAVKRSPEGLEAVFLERNGLRHGGFALRHGEGEVRELSWNSDSSCLAVLLRDRVQLWMVSNYNWKLKAEIPQAGKGKFGFVWHPERPFVLFAMNGGTLPALDIWS
jgi:elongator complex protein 1